MYEKKIIFFLRDQVIGRSKRKRGRPKKSVVIELPPSPDDPDRRSSPSSLPGSPDTQPHSDLLNTQPTSDLEQMEFVEYQADDEVLGTVSVSTVNAYCAALVDLYMQQKSMGMNGHPHPRTNASGSLNKLLKVVQGFENERKRRECEDRGKGTLLDGYYTQEQFKEIVDTFMITFAHKMPSKDAVSEP